MKKLLILTAIITGMFLFGCSDLVTNNTNQPVSSSKQLVKLPAKAGLSKDDEASLSVTKTIDGDRGGVIFLHGSYEDASGNEVRTFASLYIPRNAFDGTVDISMATDNNYAGLDFSPHMTFDKSVTLTLSFSGLDLQQLGITQQNVGFYYVDDSGNLTEVQNNGILLNFHTGTITVLGAKIDHFSRYAFAK